MAHRFEIKHATIDDLEVLVPLFEAYRLFYGQSPDAVGSRVFLKNRIVDRESIILLGLKDGRAVGFAQLYPSFSSVSIRRVCILNDLYVAPSVRRTGMATALLKASRKAALAVDGIRIELKTGCDNVSAQDLYERTGWIRNPDFVTYEINLLHMEDLS
jgi:GNAT superfamily N-acetyltransferase